MHQKTTQAFVVTTQVELKPHQKIEKIALFDENGDPIDVSSLTVQTGGNTLLTGYEIAEAPAAPEATDTVNEAIGKLAKYGADLSVQVQAIDPPYDVALTGYVIDGTGGALAATDTILEAIAKLEKRVDVLENP